MCRLFVSILLLSISSESIAGGVSGSSFETNETKNTVRRVFDKGSEARAVAAQHFTTGVKLVVVGFSRDVATSSQKLFVARFTPTSAGLVLDTKDFANGAGFLTKTIGQSSRAFDVCVDPKSNDIFVWGWGRDDAEQKKAALLLYTDPDGKTTKTSELLLINDASTHGQGLAIDSNGFLVGVGCIGVLGSQDSFVARFTKGLILDTSGFGGSKGYVVNPTTDDDGLSSVVVRATGDIFGAGFNDSTDKGIIEKYSADGKFVRRLTLATAPSRYYAIASGVRNKKSLLAAVGYESDEMVVDLYDDALARINRLPSPFKKLSTTARDVVIADDIIYVAGEGKPPSGGEENRQALISIFNSSGSTTAVTVPFAQGTYDTFCGLTPVRRPNWVVCVGSIRIDETTGYAPIIAVCNGVTGEVIMQKVWSPQFVTASTNAQHGK